MRKETFIIKLTSGSTLVSLCSAQYSEIDQLAYYHLEFPLEMNFDDGYMLLSPWLFGSENHTANIFDTDIIAITPASSKCKQMYEKFVLQNLVQTEEQLDSFSQNTLEDVYQELISYFNQVSSQYNKDKDLPNDPRYYFGNN